MMVSLRGSSREPPSKSYPLFGLVSRHASCAKIESNSKHSRLSQSFDKYWMTSILHFADEIQVRVTTCPKFPLPHSMNFTCSLPSHQRPPGKSGNYQKIFEANVKIPGRLSNSLAQFSEESPKFRSILNILQNPLC